MARATRAALLLAALTSAQAGAQDTLRSCAEAGVAGRYSVASGESYSWTLIIDDQCRYSSLRFTGERNNDIAQPTRGVARLAQVDGRDVLMLWQSSEAEFSEVLTAVRAGRRLYLVPPNQHLRFCFEWRRREEPRKGPFGRFLLRGGDEHAPAAGETPAICRSR